MENSCGQTGRWADTNPVAEQKNENCHKCSQNNLYAFDPFFSFNFCLLVIEIIRYLWKMEQGRR